MFVCESVAMIRNALLESNSMCASGCAFSDASAFGIKSGILTEWFDTNAAEVHRKWLSGQILKNEDIMYTND